ncbi:hypothetical protein DRE_01910 [Drechslerella stenobrocha 248]|uniref:Nitrate/nitrite transporter n=1 Tax=Drechslerella stenobrocha 248 TaxID=1043628 RepID=W7I8Q4_9PEZI|nr:hypothetical protein DRE_01910 [Drechslerella stenobrocha 248]
MASSVKTWFSAPEVNPINNKARTIPYFNPVNKYGRTLWFSTFGFMIAFLSWYAFSPLLSVSIKKDLHLSPAEIANSNVIALSATLLVRLIVGPLCDKYGPRYVFAGTLILGAIPTFLAGTVQNASGVMVIRFFIGILGGSFVPCQVWSTGFFDKNVVGTANAITAGIGNAGGGITYFVMPAIYDSLVHDRGLSSHVAWRVSYVVPGILILAMAFAILAFGDDTPNGPWKNRGLVNSIDTITEGEVGNVAIVVAPEPKKPSETSRRSSVSNSKGDLETVSNSQSDAVVIASHEIIQTPTWREALPVVLSLETLNLCFGYFNSFGAELAINSILGAYYLRNFPALGQTGAANWAAMFGLLNVVTRPLGGILSDVIYHHTHSLWWKKLWNTGLNVLAGVFAIIIGVMDPHHRPTLVGLIALLAIPMEMANGSSFSLVPHVHPHANGILSGLVGAFGNLGGIVFAIIFRYNGSNYPKVFYIIGAVMIAMNLVVVWIRPIPKGQIGGR